jgi:hypothetical protein
LLPTLLAVGVIAFMLAADAPSAPLSWDVITAAADEIGLSGATALTGVSIALAVSLQPLQFRLVQLLEGYWPAWTPRLVTQFGIWCERRRRQRIIRRIAIDRTGLSPTAEAALIERSQTAEIQARERFPEQERLLPTALGNALRASEDRVGQRYGLESVVIWPRLFRLLPPETQTALDDEVNQLDVSARLAVTWSFAAAICTVIVLRHPHDLWTQPLWAALVCGIWLLARLSYASAVEAAIAHGLDVEVAVDLYRSRVVDAMRLPAPAKLSQERRVFRRLCRLFQTHGASTQELVYRTEPGTPTVTT